MTQCRGRTVLVVLILVFSWLAFTCSAIALFSPAWLSWENDPAFDLYSFSFVLCRGSSGLFMRCTCGLRHANYRDLTFTFNTKDCIFIESASASSSAGWELACQILWPVGTALLLYCSIAAVSYCDCCCRRSTHCCRSKPWFSSLIWMCFLSFVATVVVVIIVGMKSTGDVNGENLFDRGLFDRSRYIHFDWGMYVAICASGLSLLTLVFTTVAACCFPSTPHSHTAPGTTHTTSSPPSYESLVVTYSSADQSTAPPSYNELATVWQSSEDDKPPDYKDITGGHTR